MRNKLVVPVSLNSIVTICIIFSLFVVSSCKKDEESQNPIPTPTPTPIKVTLFSSTSQISESSDREVAITAKLANPPTIDGSVTIELSGTAKYGTSYTTMPKANGEMITLNFAKGQTEQKIFLIPINNDKIDGNRNVTLTVSEASDHIDYSINKELYITIIDEDIIDKKDNIVTIDSHKWTFPVYKGKGDGIYTEIVYPIVGGKIGQPFFMGENSQGNFKKLYQLKEEHIKTWKFFTEIIPLRSYDGLLTQIRFDIHPSGAAAGPIDKDATEFLIKLPSLKFIPTMYQVIIHEFAHVYTIHHGELNPKTSKRECNTIWTNNGCFKVNSIGERFYNKFYKGQPFEKEYLELMNQGGDLYNSESDAYKKLSAFYKKYSDFFANQYAATNILEDLAVMFEIFILYSSPREIEYYRLRNTMNVKKVFFYFNDEKLNQLGIEIRKNMEIVKKKYKI